MSSFFSQILGSALQSLGGTGQSHAGPLSELLGGGSASGLGSLLDQLRQAGLGQQVDSWVGTGENHPVAPQDLHQALGDARMGGMARQMGLDAGSLGPILAMILPQIINALTPHGRVADEDVPASPQPRSNQGSNHSGDQRQSPWGKPGQPQESSLPDTGGDDLAGMLGRTLGRR